jgi:ABC-type antimicrobial peptide transport system permease subunit
MTMVLLAAHDASPIALAASVRTAAAGVNSSVPLYDLRTMEDLYRSRALLPSRMVSQIVSALGVLGLVLACIGLYAVVSFLFANRIQEIGIRMAVGASPPLVLGMVIRHALLLIAPGLAVLLTPMLASPAFDFVTPVDPLVLTLAPVTMASVCLIAALVPARRAARVDPTLALRQD